MKLTSFHHSPAGSPRPDGAFTVMEMLVSVALLALIMAALFGSFYQVQRAVRVGTAQKDVIEAARSAFLLMAREMQLAAPSRVNGINNFFAHHETSGFVQTLPDGGTLTNILQDFYWLTRNDPSDWGRWSLDGFFVSTDNDRSGLVGSLFRYSISGYSSNLYGFHQSFEEAVQTNANHVMDGVVNLQLRIFDARGLAYTNTTPNSVSNLSVSLPDSFAFAGDYLPAYVELEMAVLEPDALRQYQAKSVNPSVAKQFLAERAHNVHLFRQRIPIRNHHEP